MLLDTSGARLLENLQASKGTIRAGESRPRFLMPTHWCLF